MPDERVVIKIEVKSDDREIDRTRRKLERLSGARDRDRRRADRDRGLASRAERRLANQTGDAFNRVSRKYKKSFDSFDKMIKMTGGGLMKFLAFSAKAVALEMAAMGVAMVGVHLLFATGRLIMKGYHGMMKMVAGGMAGVAIAAGTMAAALREQQAAMYAFSGRGQAAEFGSALNQTRVQMRALTMDADLASVGVENLVAAYAEVAKTQGGRFTAGSKSTLKGLMDFASAGMDLKEGTKQAGSLIATLQDAKKSYAEVVTAGKKFSPQMKKALEEYEKSAGKDGKTKEALTKAIRSGELAKLGGVDGQFSAVSGTLINTLKGEFNLLRGQFADFGQQFLLPVKKEAKEVFAIISTALKRMNGQVAEFGTSGFIDKISVVVEKISNWVVRLMRDYLPGAVGIFERIDNWWDGFTDGWERMRSALEPFIEGARVVEGILKQAWLPVWEQIKENMYTFNDQLKEYQGPLNELGAGVGEFLKKLMEYFAEARKMFLEALPFINKIIGGFTQLLELFTSFLGMFTQITGGKDGKGGIGGLGGVGSLMMLIGLAKGMKNTKGYFTHAQSQSGIREVANMNVRSGVVYVNGKAMAQYGLKGSGGSSGVVKGSNTIQTMPLRPGSGPAPGAGRGVGPHTGPFTVPAGGARGGGAGFASRGAGGAGGTSASGTGASGGPRRGQFVSTPFGRAQAGLGPNGGPVITSGKYKGMEVLTQRVRGVDIPYAYGGRGTGPVNNSSGRIGQGFRSGVVTLEEHRTLRGHKIVDSTGRIITRRERIARAIGEGQRAGSTGYVRDGRRKTFMDRFLGGGRNTGASGLIGRAADRYRDRLIRKSDYLGPVGGVPGGSAPPPTPPPPPIDPGTGQPYPPGTPQHRMWTLTTNRLYGPGAVDPNSMRGRYYNSRFYNNWMSPVSGIEKDGPIQRGKIGSFIQNRRLFARDARTSRLGGMVFGNENRKGFQQSAMGGMGVMMGMGMLAQSGKVSDEAQKFLSAGAMIGMVNPLAGLAVGLGGTALTAKTEAGGAVSGAAAGAAIGTMIAPGFGTAAGAILGAAVGGLMGRVNRIKDEKKKSREAFESAFDKIITDELQVIQQKMLDSGGVGKSQIVKATSAGGRISRENNKLIDMYRGGASNTAMIDFMEKNAVQYGLDKEQIKAMRKRPEETAKAIEKVDTRQKAMNHLTDVYSKRLKELTQMTGKTEQEVEIMASQMGVDLYDATVDFNDVVQKLGVNVIKTREQLRGMQMDVALKGLDAFAKVMNDLPAPQIISEQARAFRDLYDSAGGSVTDKEFAEFVNEMVPNFLNYAGGGMQGAFELRRTLGFGGTEFTRQELDPTTGKMVKSPFFGMEKTFTEGVKGEAFQKYIQDTIAATSVQASGQLNAVLYGSENQNRFQVDAQRLSKALASMDTETAKRFASDLEGGQMFADVDLDSMTQQGFEKFMLERYGIRADQLGLRGVEKDDALNIALDKMPKELKDTYGAIIEMFGGFFDSRDETVPEWYTKEFAEMLAKSDTSTPRGKGIGDTTSSRLAQTMSRHAAMNGMLTGTRNVTSAYREFGLGSINSDHVMGRAYDLTGQNLGAYQRLVQANGGFAEFHGINGGRHLHVVPGPGRYGDAASPMGSMAYRQRLGASSGESGGITINMNVTGTGDPKATADAAVRQMRLVLENERQRR